MKKILAILLTVCMVVCMIPGAAFADSPAGWNGVTATENTDYKLVDTNNDNTPDLVEIYTNLGLAHYFSNLTTNNCDAKLINSVDMSKLNSTARTWDINTSNYAKTFDGNGRSITGLDNPLVASIAKGGVVKDLTISNSKITKSISSNETIGFITGTNAGKISGCNAGGTVSATVSSSPEISVGAITGTNSGTIENCTGNALTYTGTDTNHLDIGSIAGEIEGGTITGCTVGSISEGTLGSGATLHKGTIAGCVCGSASIISTNSTSSTIAPIGHFDTAQEGSGTTLTVSSSIFNGAFGDDNVVINGERVTFADVTAKTADFSVSSTIKKLNIVGTALTLNNANVTELNFTGSSSPTITITADSDNTISKMNCNSVKPRITRNGKLTVSTVTNKNADLSVDKISNEQGAKVYTAEIFGDDVVVSTSNVTSGSDKIYTYSAVAQAEFAGVKYATVKEAFEKAARIGGTVKLIDTTGININLEYSNGINVEKAVILDVNGHAFTINGIYDCFGNLTIKDSAATSNQKVITFDSVTINKKDNSANFQLQNGKYASDPTAYVDKSFYKVTKVSEREYTVTPLAKVKMTDSKISVSTIADQKYTKYAIMPKPVVKYGTTTLAEGSDYTLTYRNNTNIGTAYIDIKGIGNYEGTRTVSFNIVGDNALSNYTVYIPNIADQAYTGTYVKPYVSVYYGGATAVTARTLLTEGTHYTVSYSSNINAGTATVTVTGRGIYSGTVTKNFNIKYNLSNATVTTTPATYAYDGRIKQPAVTVKIGYVTVPSSDYIVTYSNNLKVGTATATVTAKTYGKSMGSNSAYFTITGKDGVITPEYAEYSKKTTKSSPFAIKIVSNTTDGTGYSYTSSDTSVATVSANGTVTPVGCGRTVITITTTGNRAYNPATATVTVTVKPAKGVISSVTSSSKGKLIVRYKRESANATAYQIRYGRAGDYTVKTVKALPSKSGKSTIKGLQSGKKYFVKVRGVKELADGTKIYGNWSKTASAVVK